MNWFGWAILGLLVGMIFHPTLGDVLCWVLWTTVSCAGLCALITSVCIRDAWVMAQPARTRTVTLKGYKGY